ALRFAFEAGAFDARQDGIGFDLGLDLGLDLAKGRGDVELAAHAEPRDALENQVEAALFERLDIDDASDAPDIVESRRLAAFLARNLPRLDHSNLTVACQHFLHHRLV